MQTVSCGSGDVDARDLVFCYELIEAFYKLSADQGIKELEEQTRAFHRDKRAAGAN